MSKTDILKMREDARNLVREYEGQDIEKIGTHLTEKSFYNHDYYRLPNGTILLLVGDDDVYTDVFVVVGDERVLVGEVNENDGRIQIGDFN